MFLNHIQKEQEHGEKIYNFLKSRNAYNAPSIKKRLFIHNE